jgi:MtrB/PioB family decaheme-associated outer membrane protein
MMKRYQRYLIGHVLLMTVPTALLTTPAHAADDSGVDPAVTELTCPRSTVDVGAGYVSQSSYKFGQYNGLAQEGGFAIGDLDLRGGGNYDSDSLMRWRLQGNDLGLDTRSGEFDFREQGIFKFNLGYDDIRDNISDTYQTPYAGVGSTLLTLPGNWIKPVVPQVSPTSLNFRSLSPTAGQGDAISPAGAVIAPTPAQLQTLDEIVVNDAGAYHRADLHTDRKRDDVGFDVNLTKHLELTGSVRQETQNGLQPIGAVSSAITENSVVLPNVIDTRTDQFNLGLQYGQPKGFVQVGYYGSVFTNHIRGISWQDPNAPNDVGTLSSAPSNQFHQLNVGGGYNFLPTMKVTGDFSYGRNTQNEAFLTDPSMPIGVPESSLHGLVITEAANLKLVMRPTSKLNMIVHYKYDNRDNRTPIDTFVFYDVNMSKSATASPFNAALGLAPNTLGSNINIFDDRPESIKKNQVDLDADYALRPGQKLAAGFQWQDTQSNCEGSWINCVNADDMVERTLHADWHASLLENFSAGLNYSYAQRRVNYDPNAWLALVPMANVIPGAPTVGATTSVYGYLTQTGLTGWGPQAGFPTTPLTGNAAIFSPNNNIVPQSLYGSRDNVSELPGMRRFDMANRDRNRIRSSLDWQATERLSAQGTLELSDDHYDQSIYGLQRATNWAASLDTTYALSDRLVVSAFYTHEDQRSRTAGDAYGTASNTAFVGKAGNTQVAGGCFNTVLAKNENGKIDPCLNWAEDMIDRADTVGLSLTKKQFLWHRLDLIADATYSRADTDSDVRGGSYANNPYALAGAPVLASGVPAVLYIPAANLPPVTTRTIDLRLSGRVSVGKAGEVRVFYEVQRMKATDYAYDGMQFGTGTEQLPTLEQAPDYTVHVVGVTFGYRF